MADPKESSFDTHTSGEERGAVERYAYTEPCDWCGHVDEFFGHAPCRIALREDREAKDTALTTERHRAEQAEAEAERLSNALAREEHRADVEQSRAEKAERERDAALDEITRTVNEYEKRTAAREREVERLQEALKLARSIAECGEPVYPGDKAIFDAALATSQEET